LRLKLSRPVLGPAFFLLQSLRSELHPREGVHLGYRLDSFCAASHRTVTLMKVFASFALLSSTLLLYSVAFGADAPPRKQATKEEIQARLAEHARKKALGPVAEAAAEKAASEKSGISSAQSPAAAATPPGATPAAAAPPPPAADAKAPTAAEEAPKILPRVEVKKERITELDRQVQKQNAEIAREKKNTKPTKLDETLNGEKVSSALAIFGGQSSDDRANISKERVAMMEDERDLIEAIAHAETKEEKAELEKTLTEARAMRRDLESALR
jgi:hypothetical protein